MKNSLQPYLKEQASHGTPDFPIGFYPCLIPRDFRDLPVHWHEELEIALVTSGRLTYAVNMNSFSVEEGDFLLIAPNTLHGAHEIPDTLAATDSIVVHLNMLRSCLSSEAVSKFLLPLEEERILPPVFHPGQKGYRELTTCFHRLWQCRQQDESCRELKIKEQLLCFLRLHWQLSSDVSLPSPIQSGSLYEEKLKTVLAYIKAHYNEPIPVARLAALCGFSEIHFMNIFKKSMGTPCASYIIEYRLAMAAADLRETGRTILQIALDNGFPNISYFNRMFKKRYQMTPSQYRHTRLQGSSED